MISRTVFGYEKMYISSRNQIPLSNLIFMRRFSNERNIYLIFFSNIYVYSWDDIEWNAIKDEKTIIFNFRLNNISEREKKSLWVELFFLKWGIMLKEKENQPANEISLAVSGPYLSRYSFSDVILIFLKKLFSRCSQKL